MLGVNMDIGAATCRAGRAKMVVGRVLVSSFVIGFRHKACVGAGLILTTTRMLVGWHGHFSPLVLQMAMPLDVGAAKS